MATSEATAATGPAPMAIKHYQQGVAVTTSDGPSRSSSQAAASSTTGLLLDHRGKHGCIAPGRKPVWAGACLCGPASLRRVSR
jgi:hypothetical protein